MSTTNSETMNTAHTLCNRVILRCFVYPKRRIRNARVRESQETRNRKKNKEVTASSSPGDTDIDISTASVGHN